jgi:excisionase family DNA binding protein
MSAKDLRLKAPLVIEKELFLKFPLPILSDDEVERVADCLLRKMQEYFPAFASSLNKEEETPIKMRDVCRLLQISDTTARSWMTKGILPFHRKGSRVFFYKSEVLSSLEQPLNNKEGKKCRF